VCSLRIVVSENAHVAASSSRSPSTSVTLKELAVSLLLLCSEHAGNITKVSREAYCASFIQDFLDFASKTPRGIMAIPTS